MPPPSALFDAPAQLNDRALPRLLRHQSPRGDCGCHEPSQHQRSCAGKQVMPDSPRQRTCRTSTERTTRQPPRRAVRQQTGSAAYNGQTHHVVQPDSGAIRDRYRCAPGRGLSAKFGKARRHTNRPLQRCSPTLLVAVSLLEWEYAVRVWGPNTATGSSLEHVAVQLHL